LFPLQKENQIDYGDPRAALLNSNVLTYERVDHDHDHDDPGVTYDIRERVDHEGRGREGRPGVLGRRTTIRD
jgi:hypothetical protein